jgi:D-arginine dehydrogenase
MKAFDVLVVGGGIAGLSVAAELSAELRVLLLEAETALGYHATGRSGAVFGRSYGNATILELNAMAARFFEAPPEGFTDQVLFKPRPWLIIARENQAQAAARWRLLPTQLEVIKAADLPAASGGLLRHGYAQLGFLDRNCGDLNVHALTEGYRRQLLSRGGEIVVGARVEALARSNSAWTVKAADQAFTAPIVVNAAGGWADAFAALADLPPLGLIPLRRSAAIVEPSAAIDVPSLPVILDAEEKFYFKPEGGKLMISPADETACAPADVQPEEIDIAHAVDRYERATGQQVRHIGHKWAGMRTFAKDRTPVVGLDPRINGFLWLAGQGGYGIQIAPALASIAAATILGKSVDPVLKTALDPSRLISRHV